MAASPSTTSTVPSLVDAALNPEVEKEKCIVAQFRTAPDSRKKFESYVNVMPREKIPIEWVIDIADESNGWFYGTAYHYDDTTGMLHVMVPDKQNPTFDGHVLLDYRTVHLIECVDGCSDALFNKCVRDSVVKVKWDVEWFEEDVDGGAGKWIKSLARFYIRMANQILVEDIQAGEHSHGYVMLTADLNVRLRKCVKDKGVDDFNRLINEGLVQATPEAIEVATASKLASAASPPHGAHGLNADGTSAKAGDKLPSIKKLADISHNLKECVSDLLDEREVNAKDRKKTAEAFKRFALDGDLDAGLGLWTEMDAFLEKEAKKATESGTGQEEHMEMVADDAWYLASRMDKACSKLAAVHSE